MTMNATQAAVVTTAMTATRTRKWTALWPASVASLRLYLLLLIVSASLSTMAMALAIQRAPENQDNATTFFSYSGSWPHYLELRQEWRPRILSNVPAGWLGRLAAHVTSTPDGQLTATIGIWTGAWVMLICLLFFSLPPGRALFYLFGSFCGIAFGYMPGFDTRAYPWDLPSLAVFTLFVVLHARGQQKAQMALIPLGMLFKETAFILCLAFLFSSEGWHIRLRRFAITALACVAVKVMADVLVGGPLPFFSMTASNTGGSFRLFHNLGVLASFPRPAFTNPLLVNGGTLLALWLLPNSKPEFRLLKAMAAVFAASLFVYAQIDEYRVWFEMIPLSLYAMDLVFLKSVQNSTEDLRQTTVKHDSEELSGEATTTLVCRWTFHAGWTGSREGGYYTTSCQASDRTIDPQLGTPGSFRWTNCHYCGKPLQVLSRILRPLSLVAVAVQAPYWPVGRIFAFEHDGVAETATVTHREGESIHFRTASGLEGRVAFHPTGKVSEDPPARSHDFVFAA